MLGLESANRITFCQTALCSALPKGDTRGKLQGRSLEKQHSPSCLLLVPISIIPMMAPHLEMTAGSNLLLLSAQFRTSLITSSPRAPPLSCWGIWSWVVPHPHKSESQLCDTLFWALDFDQPHFFPLFPSPAGSSCFMQFLLLCYLNAPFLLLLKPV